MNFMVGSEKNLHGAWVAVQVKPNHERSVQLQLAARSYEVFLPTLKESPRLGSPDVERCTALFRGYLFCRYVSGNPYRIVTSCGVIRIVGPPNSPVPVPEMEIEAIKRVVASGAKFNSSPFVQEGDPVVLVSGPLRGIEGVVVHIDNRFRVHVAITILHRSLAVEVSPQDCEPLRSSMRKTM